MLALLILLSGVGTSLAHTGHHQTGLEGAFWQGLIHPLTGLDHWIAFIAVGVVAYSLARRQESTSVKMTVAPTLGLLLGMAIGIMEGELGWLGSGASLIEYGICATLIGLGSAIVWSTFRSMKSNDCVGSSCSIYLYTAAMFVVGLPHGWAHGIEFYGAAGTAKFYGLGAALMTTVVCAAGYFAALTLHLAELRLRRPLRPLALRFAGSCLALHGIALAWMV